MRFRRRLPPVEGARPELCLPELSKLRGLFQEQEESWRRRVGSKALLELPGHRKIIADPYELANAYHRLAWSALQAMLFERAAHYFQLNKARLEVEIEHREERETEAWEVESWRESLAIGGWLTGDMEAFAGWMRSEATPRMDLEGHVSTYFHWALLGWTDDGSGCVDDLEPAAERRREEMRDLCRTEALAIVQSLFSDDSLALASFWRGDEERTRLAALAMRSSIASWEQLDNKPSDIQIGSTRQLAEINEALLSLVGDSAEPPLPERAAKGLIRYLWHRRMEPGGYLEQPIVLFLTALSRHCGEDPLVTDFRRCFPDLERVVGGAGFPPPVAS